MGLKQSRARSADSVPGKRQTGVLEELLCRQIARLPPIEDRLGDIRRQIAEADEPHETGAATPSRWASAANGTPSPSASVALNRRALRQQRDNRGSGFAANGSVPSIPILKSFFLAWRDAAVTARTESRFRHFMHAPACSRQRTGDPTN